MVLLKQLLSRIEVINEISDQQQLTEISALSSLEGAKAGDISFISSAKFRSRLSNTSASVVLLSEKDLDYCPKGSIALVVENPYVAYAKISHFFDTLPTKPASIHATAVIDESVTLGAGVYIGPYVVLEKDVSIADGVVIGAHSIVGEGTKIGTCTKLHPRVTIAHQCEIGKSCQIFSGSVIGSTGFGYAHTGSGWQPIAQIGRVILGDRVEVGANSTIDRGAIDDTLIGDDVIVDNLVMIGHNVSVGQGTAFVAQVGIAGSTKIGSGCTFAGQAGVAGHLTIADNSHFTGQAMVTKGTTEAGQYASGIPAQKSSEWRKMVSRIRQLEKLQLRISELEKNSKEDT